MTEDIKVLVEVRRGAIVESRHRGAIVAVEPSGKIIARLGNELMITSTRSTIKPIQAIPLITSGAADHFGFTSREIALACASHDGELCHTETAALMLEQAGLTEADLLCGAHAPYSESALRQLEAEGRSFSQLHNNCSGKHAGMLATAVFRGLPTAGYVAADHPVQKEIVSVFARLAGLGEHMPVAVDGCSAPTFGVPLISMATAFARLVNPDEAGGELGAEFANAARRIVAAMIAHPELVGGTKGRFDTELLRAGRGRLICKVGAEAVYAVGVLPCERYPNGLGVAFKVEDGSYRGLAPAVVETLGYLGVLEATQQQQLAAYHRPVVLNRRDVAVGDVCPVLEFEAGELQ